jgi:UDP-glucose:(heptosyl)LPS alpha-1,3-glucosyltransferase
MSNGEWENPGASAPDTHHPSPITHHQPLRIALIRQRYTAFGGAERFVARAMEALSGQGARLTVVTRAWPGDGDNGALICNPLYLGSVWRDWSFARSVCEALQERQFDLVQSHERIPCCDVFRAGDGVHREWLRQRRRVLGLWGRIGIALNPYHHYTLAAEKRLFASPRLKAVICNSRMVAAEIRRDYGLADDKIHVIYSGVDTVAYHPNLKARHRVALRERYGIPQDAPLFLYVGSGFERKGLAALLQAFAQLPPQAHLLIVGKDKKEKHFQALAARLGLTQRAHFAGGQQDVKPYYGTADAFVLPTLYDPFPNVALEAMAAGLPVITSTKSGAAELVENGKNGYVVDALDIAGLSAAMTQLLAPALTAQMGAAARLTVEPYNLEVMGEKLVGLYRKLLR